MSMITVATIQFAPAITDCAGNRERIAKLLDRCRRADLIVVPELAVSGYDLQDRQEAAALAEPATASSPTIRMLAEKAKELEASIVCGFCEVDPPTGQLYNSAVLVKPGEGLTDVYRKNHLFEREKWIFEPGNGFILPSIRLADGTTARLGILVCFDWFFLESWRTLALMGADLVAHPANLVIPESCQASLPTLARMNRIGIVSANRWGDERRLRFTGASTICNPRGGIEHQAPEEGDDIGIATLDLTLARDKQATATNNLFTDRRPDLYTPICEPIR